MVSILTLMGLSGSGVISVYHLFIFLAHVTPHQMVDTFVYFISIKMINLFCFLYFLFLCLLYFCSRMGRPKGKKELEKDGYRPKPRSQGSAHKGGDLKCHIVGLGLNCKFIDLLFKCSFIKFIKISSHLDFIVSEIIYNQTDTLTQGLMNLR